MEITQETVEKIIKKYDAENNYRNLVGIVGLAVAFFGIILSIFHVYTAGFGVLNEISHRAIHLSFVLGLTFLVFPRKSYTSNKKKDYIFAVLYVAFYFYMGINLMSIIGTETSTTYILSFWVVLILTAVSSLPIKAFKEDTNTPSFFDYPLMCIGIAISLYLLVFFKELFIIRPGDAHPTDLMMGVLAIMVVIEATRRTMGNALAIIGMISLLYAFWGPYMPGIFSHRGYNIGRIISHVYLGTEGIYGIATGVVATYVFHFVLFGILAQHTGLGQLFINLSNIVAGRYAGGSAKISVVSSGLLGMISGSSIANTVTTGAFTIPMMKKKGFTPEFAAGVEASASTGGQITPPIMGAAAFVMTELLDIPYNEIILLAILPASFHYLSALIMVHFEAKRLGIAGEDMRTLPKLREILSTSWHLFIPVGIMVSLLLMKFSPFFAAFWGIISTIVVSYFPLAGRIFPFIKLKEETVLTPKKLFAGFEEGAKSSLAITASCACVGFILGTTTLTGMGFKLSGAVISLSSKVGVFISSLDPFGFIQEQSITLFLALIIVFIACVLMGAGIPTTPTYIILASIAAPSLQDLGVPLLVTHFFVFYYGVLADVTPPVALAAYAGAGIAGSDAMRTGITAFGLSMGKALVPFMFVYAPSLLFINFTWTEFLLALSSGIVCIISLSTAYIGYLFTNLKRTEAILLTVGGIILVWSGPYVVIIGTIFCTIAIVQNFMRAKSIVKNT